MTWWGKFVYCVGRWVGQSYCKGKRRLATVLVTSLCKRHTYSSPPLRSHLHRILFHWRWEQQVLSKRRNKHLILHGIINHRTFAVEIVHLDKGQSLGCLNNQFISQLFYSYIIGSVLLSTDFLGASW